MGVMVPRAIDKLPSALKRTYLLVRGLTFEDITISILRRLEIGQTARRRMRRATEAGPLRAGGDAAQGGGAVPIIAVEFLSLTAGNAVGGGCIENSDR